MNIYLVYPYTRPGGILKASPVIVHADSPHEAAAQFYNHAVVVPCWVYPKPEVEAVVEAD